MFSGGLCEQLTQRLTQELHLVPNHTKEFGRKAWRHSNHNRVLMLASNCARTSTQCPALHQRSFCEASLWKDFHGHKHIPQSPSRQSLLPWQQWPFPQSRSASPSRSMNSKQGKPLQEALAIRSLHLHCFLNQKPRSPGCTSRFDQNGQYIGTCRSNLPKAGIMKCIRQSMAVKAFGANASKSVIISIAQCVYHTKRK